MNDIVAFIQKYQAENPTGWRKWIIGSVVTVLILVVVAVAAFQATQRGKELARLHSERDRAKEAAHRNQVNTKLAKNKEEAAIHEAEANRSLALAESLENEIKQLESQHETNQAVINSIRSWEDVDKRVK